MAENRDILIITADAVKDNGITSYMFMVDADHPDCKLDDMPNLFGHIRKADPLKESYSINVFDGGKGLVMGGGFGEGSDPDWEKQMFDAIPSCTLLMDIDHLPWWEEITARHGVTFRRHHHNGILRTS